MSPASSTHIAETGYAPTNKHYNYISLAQLFYFCLPRELCVGEEDIVPSLLDEPGECRLVVLKVGSW